MQFSSCQFWRVFGPDPRMKRAPRKQPAGNGKQFSESARNHAIFCEPRLLQERIGETRSSGPREDRSVAHVGRLGRLRRDGREHHRPPRGRHTRVSALERPRLRGLHALRRRRGRRRRRSQETRRDPRWRRDAIRKVHHLAWFRGSGVRYDGTGELACLSGAYQAQLVDAALRESAVRGPRRAFEYLARRIRGRLPIVESHSGIWWTPRRRSGSSRSSRCWKILVVWSSPACTGPLPAGKAARSSNTRS